MSLDKLADVFLDELKDVLSAERQLLKAIPKMIKKATSPDLRKALEAHLVETEGQVTRVEAAFEETGKPARAITCEAMKGLITEAESMMAEEAPEAVMDAIIIAMAQKVEHYEIATYGTLCVWAKTLGYTNALRLLKETINQEEKADKKLSQLAESINFEAVEAS